MQSSQKEIFYITGESKSAVENSPFLEYLKLKNIEVLLLVEAIDEYCIGQLKEYASLKLVCVSKEGIKIDKNSESDWNYNSSKFDGLTSLIKEILGDRIGKVIMSTRLVKAPCIIVTSEYSWTANMERLMKAQALNNNTMGMYMSSSKTFEINPRNLTIEELRKRAEMDSSDSTVKDLIILLFDTSLVSSGFSLEDPNSYPDQTKE
jgi:molecular chaperone HtpG